MNQPIILTSTSRVKLDAIRLVENNFVIRGVKCEDSDTVSQPLNNTVQCAQHRIDIFREREPDYVGHIISIENGLEEIDGVWHECCVLVSDAGRVYRGPAVPVYPELMERLFSSGLPTLGEVMRRDFDACADNWVDRISTISRLEQIGNVFTQWIIDRNIPRYPDFPRPGVEFVDTCALALDPDVMRTCFRTLEGLYPYNFDCIAAIESRGYLLGLMFARALGMPMICLRKKVPGNVKKVSYTTEYSSDAIGMAATPHLVGKRALVVDDLCATGGSFRAARQVLLENGIDPTTFYALYRVGSLAGKTIDLNVYSFITI